MSCHQMVNFTPFHFMIILFLCLWFFLISFFFLFFFVISSLVETKPRLTKERAFVLGTEFFFFYFFVCYFTHVCLLIGTSKTSLTRTLDVYDLQELSDEPDPHATLPFISHHTLNISRDLVDKNNSNSTPFFMISCNHSL